MFLRRGLVLLQYMQTGLSLFNYFSKHIIPYLRGDDETVDDELHRGSGAYTRPLLCSTSHAFRGIRWMPFVCHLSEKYPKTTQDELKSGRASVSPRRGCFVRDVDVGDGRGGSSGSGGSSQQIRNTARLPDRDHVETTAGGGIGARERGDVVGERRGEQKFDSVRRRRRGGIVLDVAPQVAFESKV